MPCPELSMSVHTAYMISRHNGLIIWIDPLCAKFRWWNMTIYLHLISLPQNAMMKIVEVIIHERQGLVYPIQSIPWMLMPHFSSGILRLQHLTDSSHKVHVRNRHNPQVPVRDNLSFVAMWSLSYCKRHDAARGCLQNSIKRCWMILQLQFVVNSRIIRLIDS